MTAFAVGTLDVSSKPPVRRNLWAGVGFYRGSTPWHSDGEKKVCGQLTEVLCLQTFTVFLLLGFGMFSFVLQPLTTLSLAKIH